MPSSRIDFAKDFGRAAALYARLRPGYPRSVFDALSLRLEGRRAHVVELGAGTGQATLALAEMFERVTAVEPDARMAAQIPERAEIERTVMAAEDAEFAAGAADAVVAATSFHWMDQDLVVARAFDWLRPGGVFFAFMYGVFVLEGAAEEVFLRHLPLWAPYKDDRLLEKYDAAPPILASGLFASVEPFAAQAERTYSPQDAAALLATTSYAAAYARDHGGAETYLDRLAKELVAAAAEIRIRFPISGAIAVKAREP